MSTFSLHSDQDLLSRMQENDEQALEILFKTYYTSLCRFARTILKDTQQSEDMVQDVFMKVWDKRHQINITTSFKSYLFTAVRNHCFNAIKQNDRKYWMEDGMEDDMRIAVDMPDRFAEKSLQEKISHAIDSLPDKCKLTFQLSRYEQMSYKQIAETMNVSVKTVENQIGKALTTLRITLDPYIRESLMLLLSLFFIR